MKRLLWVILAVFALVSVGALTAQDDAPPFLGITFAAAEDGVLVTRVLRGTAAGDAGLQVGDVITAANDEAVTTESLPALVAELAVGDTLSLDILRDGEALTLEARLQARPMVQERLRVGPLLGRGFLGVTLETTDDGLQIAAVSAGSPAAEAGLQAGDIVTALNGEEVTTPIAAARLISSLEPGATLTLDILRDGESLELEAILAGAPALGRMLVLPGDVIVYDGTNWRIMGLAEGSPLAAAGLETGDVITAVDGEAPDPAALAELLAAEADTSVVLTVERGDETLDVTVNVADLNILGGMGFFRGREGRGSRGNMPFRLEMLPGAVRLGVQFEMVDQGARITEVLPESPAAEAGLQVDDIVARVGGDVVDAERTLRDRILAYEAGDTVTLEVLRAGETLELDVTLEVQTFERGDMPFFRFRGMPFEFDGENMPHFFFGPRGAFRIEPEPVAPLAPNA
jgi:S1-C subfamily serine protease